MFYGLTLIVDIGSWKGYVQGCHKIKKIQENKNYKSQEKVGIKKKKVRNSQELWYNFLVILLCKKFSIKILFFFQFLIEIWNKLK